MQAGRPTPRRANQAVKDEPFSFWPESQPGISGQGLLPKHDTSRLFQSRLAGWDPFGFYCRVGSRSTVTDPHTEEPKRQEPRTKASAAGPGARVSDRFWCFHFEDHAFLNRISRMIINYYLEHLFKTLDMALRKT
jgi:hypothetical protein